METEKTCPNLSKYGIAAACAAGAYLIWSNRTKIMSFLNEQGVSFPEIKKTVTDAVHTGVDKIKDVVSHEGTGSTYKGARDNSAGRSNLNS